MEEWSDLYHQRLVLFGYLSINKSKSIYRQIHLHQRTDLQMKYEVTVTFDFFLKIHKWSA